MTTALVKKKLGTNVPSSPKNLVERFNQLNGLLLHGIAEMAHASDTLMRHRPLLREMQALLSQRPKGASNSRFTMTGIRKLWLATSAGELPTWTEWMNAYSRAIDYSVRHIRRVVFAEPRKKYTKECAWSVVDHNNLLRAASLAEDLINAIEAHSDTTALVAEGREIFEDARDLLDKPFEPVKRALRKNPARRVTHNIPHEDLL